MYEEKYMKSDRSMDFKTVLLKLTSSSAPQMLYWFKKETSKLIIYDPRSNEDHRTLTIDRTVPNAAAWAFLNDTEILITGGVRIQAAWSIEIEDWAVTDHPDMEFKRCGHGIVAIGRSIYVFGGFDGSGVRTCEEFSNNAWRRLPDL